MPPPPTPTPDEPAFIVRACLASKLWLGLLTGTAFHGRYRDFHGAPPMLGFYYCRPPDSLERETQPLYVSTTKFRPHIPRWGSGGCNVLDCRHGRLLLGDKMPFPSSSSLFRTPWRAAGGTWAPMFLESYGAAVLCAVTGCDHRACHDGPFRVVFVGLDQDLHAASVWLSLPDMGECGEPLSDFQSGEWVEACSGVHIEDAPYIEPTCPVFVQGALHFMLVFADDDDRAGILKYDLTSNSLSLIDAPLDVVDSSGATILMEMEDGTLGFAYVGGLTLYLWSRQLGSDGAASWTECKVINLKEIIPAQNPENRLTLIGTVLGSDIVFVNTDLGIGEINLKTLQWRKIWKRE